MEQEYDEIDLRELFAIIMRRWWLIVVFFVLSTTITYFVTDRFMDPIYEAKSSLFLGKEQNEIGGIGVSLSELQTFNQLIVDYKELAETRLVIDEVIEKLGLNIDIKTFRDSLRIDTIKNSRLFTISFQHSNPQLAADITNAVAEELLIKATEIVEVKNIRIIDTALVPEKPIKPRKLVNTTIAGVLGIMIAVFAVFILEFFNNTIKTEEDIEKKLGLTTIGLIPSFEGEEKR